MPPGWKPKVTWAAPLARHCPAAGQHGMEVRLVQFWLRLAADNYSGLSHVTVDGSYGPATVRAVTAFQNRFSLAADGVTGAAPGTN